MVRQNGTKQERIDALSGRLRSGLGSGGPSGLSTKIDSEMAAPIQFGHPHAPTAPQRGERSANGSTAIDFLSQGDHAPLLT